MTSNKLTSTKCFIFVILFQVFCSCKNKEVVFNGIVFKNEKKNYGYAIYLNKKIVIKQEIIPSLRGNISFKDSIDALKVMDLVLEKLNTGKSPTVDEKELKELNIKM